MGVWAAAVPPWRISPAEFASAPAQALITQLDQYLLSCYPPASIYSIEPQGFTVPGAQFWLAWEGTAAVGCVGIRPLAPGVAELKRLYVVPQWRGRGLGRALVATAEAGAIALGYGSIRLETGERQPESIALYTRCGYQPIPCFGPYVGDIHSRCFEKPL